MDQRVPNQVESIVNKRTKRVNLQQCIAISLLSIRLSFLPKINKQILSGPTRKLQFSNDLECEEINFLAPVSGPYDFQTV